MKIHILLSLGIALWLLNAQAYGQTSAGRVSGKVLDASSAVIPGAKVTARNVETGVAYNAKSNAEGSYLLYPLPPGVYSITAEANGFRTEHMDGLQIEVAAVVSRDIHLTLGKVQESIEVSASSPPLLTQSMSVESTVVREQIESLPLNGRDFNQLVLLGAGAMENAGGRDFGTVAINGNRAFSNDYLLDGTPNNSVFGGNSSMPVSVDVIQEFKVTSGVAAAEYGQAGTQVTMVTRSGTNRFHGSAFEYHRGTTFQARDPFNSGAIPPFARNQFGGSLGGPIRRNGTFFFLNYEGNRQNETDTQVSTAPLDAYWNGDFSSVLARKITVRDPLATGRPPFAGNMIPASRLDPVALKLRPFWGSPNQPGSVNNLIRFADATNTSNQFTTRIDHTLPRNQNLMFRYSQQTSDAYNPSQLANTTGTSRTGGQYNASLGWTAPLSATTINELRVGFAEQSGVVLYDPGDLPTGFSLGIKGVAAPDPVRAPMPRIWFAGNDSFTSIYYGLNESMAASNQRSKTTNLSETITLVRGNHTIKAGIEYRRYHIPALLQPQSGGSIAFRATTGVNSSGFSFGDFLLSLPTNATEVPPMPENILNQQQFASYVQDDWRATRRLTISLGLRHEIANGPSEEYNRLAFFDPASGAIVVASDNGKLPTDQFSPAITSKLTDASGNWRFPIISDKQAGFNPRSLVDSHYRYFGPRVGFAYQAGGKFVVRGGYGIFYTRYPIQYLQQTMSVNPPFAAVFNYQQRITNGLPSVTLENPYGGQSSANVAPGGLERNFQLPSNQQWNLTLERDLGWGTVLSVGYVGNKGTHLFRAVNPNQGRPDPVTNTLVRPYSATYGNVGINLRRTDGVSLYNAMQTEFRRRTRKGLTFQGNWTWAKCLDNVGPSVNLVALDVENLGRDRANSDYVRRHMFKFNTMYELPFGRGRALFNSAPRWLDAAVGGWRLSGIWSYTTGRYFTPIFTSTSGLGDNRPDIIYGVQANLPAGERSASRWFNPAAFTEPALNPVTGLARTGNAGRNILVGPGTNTVDLSLAKSIPVFGEGRRLTFRLEFFNALNHPNYDLPEANISNTNTVATISDTIRPMRQAQLAIRFDF